MNHESLDRIHTLRAQQAHQLASVSRLPKLTHEEREIRRLREDNRALEPVAAAYDALPDHIKDMPASAKPFSGLDITVGDLKAAYDACRRRAGV